MYDVCTQVIEDNRGLPENTLPSGIGKQSRMYYAGSGVLSYDVDEKIDSTEDTMPMHRKNRHIELYDCTEPSATDVPTASTAHIVAVTSRLIRPFIQEQNHTRANIAAKDLHRLVLNNMSFVTWLNNHSNAKYAISKLAQEWYRTSVSTAGKDL